MTPAVRNEREPHSRRIRGKVRRTWQVRRTFTARQNFFIREICEIRG